MNREDIDDITLENDIEAGTESPFRRRSKAVPVRRGRARRLKTIVRWGFLLVLTLVLLGYGGYRLSLFGSRSPEFDLNSSEDVLLTGTQYVSREEVINALGLPRAGKLPTGINIFKMSMDEKCNQLESIPWVEKATVTRAYPNRLAVHIEERTPVAFVSLGSHIKLVDAKGVLLEKPDRASFNFPVVTGLESSSGPADRAARLNVYSLFARDVTDEASEAGWSVSEVNLADTDDLKAMLAKDRETIELHFGRRSFVVRFRNFLVLLPELRKSGRPVDSIDLRYGQQVVVKPRAESPLLPQELPETAPDGIREN